MSRPRKRLARRARKRALAAIKGAFGAPRLTDWRDEQVFMEVQGLDLGEGINGFIMPGDTLVFHPDGSVEVLP